MMNTTTFYSSLLVRLAVSSENVAATHITPGVNEIVYPKMAVLQMVSFPKNNLSTLFKLINVGHFMINEKFIIVIY